MVLAHENLCKIVGSFDLVPLDYTHEVFFGFSLVIPTPHQIQSGAQWEH